MSDRGKRGGRLPKGHPKYYAQLNKIREYYKKKAENRQREPIGEPEPDTDWWEDVPIEDEDFEAAIWELEEEERLANISEEERRKIKERTDEWEANIEAEEKRRKQTVENPTDPTPGGSKEKSYTYQTEITEHFPKKKQRKEKGDRMDWGDDDVAPPTHHGDLGAGQGGGGGPGGGGSGGNNIENEMHFGKTTKPITKHYRKSFLINITNGKEYLALSRVGSAVGVQTAVNWNEGWQIIPWADMRAYMTPTDYFEVTVMMRKWRIKKCGFKVEGIIPFQVDLTGATNSTTATFNNRINIHHYFDDGELLPDVPETSQDLAHNDQFTVPWGEGTEGKLKSPNFQFQGADQPSAFRYYTDPLFQATEPQKYFSLYNTGHVKSCYPGQKFGKTWVNPNSNWVGRSTNDKIANVLNTTTAAAIDIDTDVNRFNTQAYRSGVSGKGPNLKDVPNTAAGYNVSGKYMYIDTGVPCKFQGPPYVLVRVEPYPNLGTGGGLIDIYAQAHIHYDMEIECFPLEKPATYVPFKTGAAVAQGTGTSLQEQLYRDTCLGITDNKVHRLAGVTDNDAIYT